jgi:CO/xanthine dehydrogenase FAD-binding subunit
MFLPKFDFHEPATEAEAFELMADFGKDARPLAGGTDLMVNLKKKILNPKHLVSLARITALQEMASDNGTLIIGAGCTIADLAQSEEIAKKVSALSSGAKSLGSPLIRNLATIGGNIGSARPAADLPPSLIACGASVVLKSVRGERTLTVEDVITGPGKTTLQPDEIITAVHVPLPGVNAAAGYMQLGARKAQDCNLVNVASFISLNDDGTISKAKIVMGSVGPVPLRAGTAESILVSEKPSDSLFRKAGEAASADSRPILDFRGTAEYKRAMVSVLTRRTLAMALQEIQNRS